MQKCLLKIGHDVTVIVKSDNKTKLETTETGYKVLRFKLGGKPYYNYLGYENALAYQYYEETIELIKHEGKPDLIEIQDTDALGQYLVQCKKLFKEELQNIPIVLHVHTKFSETSTKYKHPNYWKEEMRKFCIKGADALLCPNQLLAEMLQPLVPDKKIKVISHLCDTEDNLIKIEEFFKKTIEENTKDPMPKEFPFINSDIPKKPYEKEYEGKKDLLSVVIPYYNLGSTLPETIQSIKESTYKDMEIVIVNDGSTDEDSKKVLNEYRNDAIIRVVDIENKGLANARNVGAENAKGEFIAFLDADDKIDKTFYEKSIRILNYYNNISYVYSWVMNFEGAEGIWPTFNTHLPYLLCSNMLAAFVVIRKNDFLNFGKNKLDMEYGMEDYDSWISLANNGYFGVAIPEPLNIYRIRKNSMARKFNKEIKIHLYNVMSSHYPELYQKYSREIFMLLNSNGQSYYWNNPTTPVIDPHDREDNVTEPQDQKMQELKKIMNSKFGNFCINLFFKLRLNKLFK